MTKKPRGRGRRSVINDVKQDLIRFLREGETIEVACQKLNIHVRTYNRWISQGKNPLPEQPESQKETQAYCRELYLEIEAIKLKRKLQIDAQKELETGESRTVRNKKWYEQAEKAFEDALFGKQVEHWTSNESLIITKADGSIERHEKVIEKTVQRSPAQWAVVQMLPDIDITKYIQTGIEIGLLQPEVLDRIQILQQTNLANVIALCQEYLAKTVHESVLEEDFVEDFIED